MPSWASISSKARFISHRLPLHEINRAFELMEAQDGIRSVIEL
jgi:Zn-dependent alcohol dehydrogenase